MNVAGALEDIRGSLEGLRDYTDPETGFYGRLEGLIAGVDDALAVLGAGSGCSLCAAGHVPARPCGDSGMFGKPPGYWAGRCCEPSPEGHLPCLLAQGHDGPHGHEQREDLLIREFPAVQP